MKNPSSISCRPFDRARHATPVSEIGLGCWQLGADWGEVSDDDALAILRTARDTGVTFYDTAAGYGGGRSERLLGAFRREAGNDGIFIATKIGRKEPTEAHLREGIDASRERLGMDCLDLIQLHCWPLDHLREPIVWQTLRALQSEGKIARFGSSVESVEEARLCMAEEGCVSLQIIFNLFRQHVREEIFVEAKEKGVALIVRVPLASGLLGGKFGQATKFGENDHRHYNRDGAAFHVGETFGGLTFEKGLELVGRLREILPDEPPLPVQALRWILDHDAVTTVIPGATRLEQVEANAQAASAAPLAPELHERLAAFYRTEVAQHVRGQY